MASKPGAHQKKVANVSPSDGKKIINELLDIHGSTILQILVDLNGVIKHCDKVNIKPSSSQIRIFSSMTESKVSEWHETLTSAPYDEFQRINNSSDGYFDHIADDIADDIGSNNQKIVPMINMTDTDGNGQCLMVK